MSNSKTKSFLKELYIIEKEECIFVNILSYPVEFLLLGLFRTPYNKWLATAAEQ